MRKLKYLLVILAAAAILFAFPAFAASGSAGSDVTKESAYGGEYLFVTSKPYTDKDEKHVPDETLEEDGKVYRLKSVEYRDTVVPGGLEDVSDTIVYEQVALDSEIPKEAEISVRDEALGGDELDVAVGKLVDYYFENVNWENFSFIIVCEEPDARAFDFEGERVTLDDDAPLAGHEDLILKSIDATPGLYEIDHVEWEGDIYKEGDMPCRNLRAYGRAKVGDCVAKYEGKKDLPDINAREYFATYALEDEDEAGVRDESVMDETSISSQDDAGSVTEEEKGFWDKVKDLFDKIGRLISKAIEWVTATPLRTFLSVTTILILGFVIWLLIFLNRKAKKEKEKLEDR